MRIGIAEDNTLLREGLSQLLQAEGHTVVFAVGDAEAVFKEITLADSGGADGADGARRPDLVLLDVRMPPTFVDEGIQAALRIRREYGDIAVLVLSQYVERRHARELMDGRGGAGYLLKDRVSDISRFLDALDTVHDGGTAFDPEVIRQLINADGAVGTGQALSTLTERERDVLKLLAEGHSNASIAETLFMSQSGVEKHVNTIFTKLGIASGSTYNRRVLAVLAFLGTTGEG